MIKQKKKSDNKKYVRTGQAITWKWASWRFSSQIHRFHTDHRGAMRRDVFRERFAPVHISPLISTRFPLFHGMSGVVKSNWHIYMLLNINRKLNGFFLWEYLKNYNYNANALNMTWSAFENYVPHFYEIFYFTSVITRKRKKCRNLEATYKIFFNYCSSIIFEILRTHNSLITI